MTAKSPFHSLLAEDIQLYLAFKRATGRKFRTEAGALRLLDRYLSDNNVTDRAALTPPLIESFLISRPRTRPASFNHLLSVIRCFFAWIITQGRLTHSPVQMRSRSVNSRRLPFLFEPEEICRLLEMAGQLRDRSRGSHRAEVYSLILRLLYGLGLRVGEVTRLCYVDIDLNRRLLIIRESKFGKSRLVPFGPNLESHIETYLTRRISWYGQWRHDDPIFSFSRDHRKPLWPETISQTFHHLLEKTGISPTPGTRSPCLHCLRHSFAVQTLLRWYRSGIDPGRRLFHLSIFMGHTSPDSTSWYLTITDELLKEANQRFEHLVGAVSKEVNL